MSGLQAKVLYRSDGQAEMPCIAILPNGDILVVFVDGHHFNHDSDLLYTLYSQSSGTWTTPEPISGRSSFTALSFVKFDRGLVHTVTRETTSQGEGLFYHRGLPEGPWKRPIKIADKNKDPGYYVFDIDSQGNTHIVWSEGNSHLSKNIYYKRLLFEGSPDAIFETSELSGIIPFKVDFDASGSYDEDGEIIRYRWDFGDGRIGFGEDISRTFKRPGQFTVSLAVIDNDFNVGTESVEVLVSGGDPFAVITTPVTQGMIPLKSLLMDPAPGMQMGILFLTPGISEMDHPLWVRK